MVASFALSLESPQSVVNNHITSWRYKFPADYWDRYPERIAAVTQAQVQEAAKKYLDSSRLQIVAVGEAKIADILKGYGTFEVYDTEGSESATEALCRASGLVPRASGSPWFLVPGAVLVFSCSVSGSLVPDAHLEARGPRNRSRSEEGGTARGRCPMPEGRERPYPTRASAAAIRGRRPAGAPWRTCRPPRASCTRSASPAPLRTPRGRSA
jgi:hypothetical protein